MLSNRSSQWRFALACGVAVICVFLWNSQPQSSVNVRAVHSLVGQSNQGCPDNCNCADTSCPKTPSVSKMGTCTFNSELRDVLLPEDKLEAIVEQYDAIVLDRLWAIERSNPKAYSQFDNFVNVDVCPGLSVLGVFAANDDQEKRICGLETVFEEGCAIFSFGSNDEWAFEIEAAEKTDCMIHVYDCTVSVWHIPPAIKDRVVYHNECLGRENKKVGGKQYSTWNKVIADTKVDSVAYLKMDIEGGEFDVFYTLLRSGTDIMPDQMAVEIHDVFGGGLYDMAMMADVLWTAGGYVTAHRRDNKLCALCVELLFVRVCER